MRAAGRGRAAAKSRVREDVSSRVGDAPWPPSRATHSLVARRACCGRRRLCRYLLSCGVRPQSDKGPDIRRRARRAVVTRFIWSGSGGTNRRPHECGHYEPVRSDPIHRVRRRGTNRRPHECGHYEPVRSDPIHRVKERATSRRPHECGHYEPSRGTRHARLSKVPPTLYRLDWTGRQQKRPPMGQVFPKPGRPSFPRFPPPRVQPRLGCAPVFSFCLQIGRALSRLGN